MAVTNHNTKQPWKGKQFERLKIGFPFCFLWNCKLGKSQTHDRGKKRKAREKQNQIRIQINTNEQKPLGETSTGESDGNAEFTEEK